MRIELTAFTDRGRALAAGLAESLTGRGHQAACTREGMRAADWTALAFGRADALIFVGAAGIAVRSIAPHLRSKATDPAVVVVDEGGHFAIPILSGHLGGANDLARELSELLGCQCVLTTATDVNGVFAFDQWAREMDCAVPHPERILPVSQAMLAGECVGVWSRWSVEGELPPGIRWTDRAQARVRIDWSCGEEESAPLVLVPRALTLGVGCRKGTPAQKLEGAWSALLNQFHVYPEAVRTAASVTLKAEEPGLLDFCQAHRLPLSIYTPEELSGVEGSFTPSAFVQKVTGVDNICERAAALAAGGQVVVPKQARNGVTMALAQGEITLHWRRHK